MWWAKGKEEEQKEKETERENNEFAATKLPELAAQYGREALSRCEEVHWLRAFTSNRPDLEEARTRFFEDGSASIKALEEYQNVMLLSKVNTTLTIHFGAIYVSFIIEFDMLMKHPDTTEKISDWLALRRLLINTPNQENRSNSLRSIERLRERLSVDSTTSNFNADHPFLEEAIRNCRQENTTLGWYAWFPNIFW